MSHFIPVYSHPDRMPVDISFVFENEKPAGKHGFTHVEGDNLVFEDGKIAKFWGVIFNGAASFPEHDYAKQVAQRLAQTGCNIVRFHQLDSEWATPNIYRLTAGARLKTTRVLNPESLDRLDYLIMCLKEQGIYATVDMCTYRKFKSGDGVKFANMMGDNSKMYAHFDPTMIELQKEFCTNFWNHKNPYTGLLYKEDPIFVMCDISNENDMFKDQSKRKDYLRIEYYDNMFRDMFAQWLKEQKIDYDAYGCPLFNNDDPMIHFRIELERRYADTMYKHIRSLGVNVPLCDTNWIAGGGLVKAQENMDFQDGHCYFYDWRWGEYEKVTGNASLTTQTAAPLGAAASTRIHNQPMFMTEWDMPWSNSYRAEGPIWFPAVAAFQNWTGMCIHTYAYGTHLSSTDLLGKEASSSTIGSIPYREGIFSVWNDPAKFGLFYHGAMMFRRGDIKPGLKKVGARIKPEHYSQINKQLPSSVMEIHQVASVLDTTDTKGLDEIMDITETYPREDPKVFVSDTGELRRDLKRAIGTVDTPRTKAAYGFLGRAGSATMRRPNMKIYMNDLTIDCFTDFGTIALSSLSDAPICESDDILMSAIGRAHNTDMQFDGEKLVDYGRSPIMAEVIDAEIELKTSRENLRVWSVNSDGYYIGRLETTYEDGVLKFHIGPNFPGIYYLIMEE